MRAIAEKLCKPMKILLVFSALVYRDYRGYRGFQRGIYSSFSCERAEIISCEFKFVAVLRKW